MFDKLIEHTKEQPRVSYRVGCGLFALALLLGLLIFFGYLQYSTTTSTNHNTNTNANANRNANLASSPTPVANANANRAPTRQEYETNKERYQREAKESGRTVGTGPNDEWLWIKTRFDLAAADDLRDTTINVDVENGVVALSGTLASEAQRTKALQIAANVEGVKAVKDHLVVSKSSPSVSPTPSPIESATATVFDIDREVERLKNGAAITEVPTSMELDEIRTVALTLSPSTAQAAISAAEKEMHANLNQRSGQAPARRLETKTKIETEQAQYSSFMEATLTGQGFEIKPITPERQPVTSGQPTKWSWDVKAKTAGDQDLHLAMNAIFESEGAEKTTRTRSVNTFSKTITVKVSWRSRIATFISNNWQWLMTAILIPLVVWGASKLRKSTNKNKKPKKKKK